MSERKRLILAMVLVASLGIALALLGRAESSPKLQLSSELVAVESALQAWAAWAGDGDLRRVESLFADGPQLAQLRLEDSGIVPGLPYRFALRDAAVLKPGLVRGKVVLGRFGEIEQSFRWDIELVKIDDIWRLWTVRTTGS
jgi:hypothetical protein